MFDINSLNKLTDAIPADVKEKVAEVVKQQLSGNLAEIKNSAIEQLGLSNLVGAPASEAVTVAPAAEFAVAQADETSELTVNGAAQLESPESEEDETDAA
jgi:hypothetical protein